MAIMQRTFRSWRRPWHRWRALADRRDRYWSGTTAMLRSETDGVAIDFAADHVVIKEAGQVTRDSRLDDFLTYTTTTAKLVYGSDGVLRYARHNRLLQSQDVSGAAWIRSGSVVTADTLAAPDGTMTADRVADTAINAGHEYHPATGLTLVAAPHRFSVYLKKGTHSRATVTLATPALGVGGGVEVDLNAGTIGAPLSFGGSVGVAAAIEPVGDDWYRVSVTVNTVAGTNYVAIWMTDASFNRTYLGTGTYLYSWGHQLQQLPCHDETYLATTAAARFGLPFDHDPSTREPVGVLIEEARTNLVIRSQEFDDATWVKGFTTASADATQAPDGMLTADTVKETTGNGSHTLLNATTVLSAPIGTYTMSLYVKYAGRRWFRIAQTLTEGANCDVDLFARTVAISGAIANRASIIPLANDWFRVTLTYTTTSVHNLSFVLYLKDAVGATGYVGDPTMGLHIWGAQLEDGQVATSYVPTASAAVARAADSVSAAVSSLPIDETKGAFILQAGAAAFRKQNAGLVELTSGANTERLMTVYFGASNTVRMYAADDGVAQVDVGIGTAGLSDFKVAATYAANSYAGVVNGGSVIPDTAATLASGMTSVFFGNNVANTGQPNCHLKSVTYLPRRLSNSELQARTL